MVNTGIFLTVYEKFPNLYTSVFVFNGTLTTEVCRDRDSNTKTTACLANTLTDCMNPTVLESLGRELANCQAYAIFIQLTSDIFLIFQIFGGKTRYFIFEKDYFCQSFNYLRKPSLRFFSSLTWLTYIGSSITVA